MSVSHRPVDDRPPPRALESLLERSLPPRQREFVCGDLREEFAARSRDRGRAAAVAWYGYEVTRSLRPAIAALLQDWMRGRSRRVPTVGDFAGRAGLRARVDSIRRDLRFAGRSMRHRPGHTALIAVTLSAGIGATTAIFTIVDHVLLRPLPYDRPDELVMVWNVYPAWEGHEVLDRLWDRVGLSYPEYADWRREQTAFEDVAIYGVQEATLRERGDPARVWLGTASASLLPMLGVRPVIGRSFAPGESGPGAAAVALLSHDMWAQQWGGDPSVLGQTVRLDDRSYTMVGVLPPRWRFLPVAEIPGLDEVDVWVPVGAYGAALDDRGTHVYEGIARTGPAGLTPEAVRETRLAVAGVETTGFARDVRITPRREEEIGTARGPLLLLLGAVGLLMLITCVNVATLLLGQLAGRRAELATRAALGAGRRRLVTQLAVEALAFGALGIAGGLFLGTWVLRLLVTWAPADLGLPGTIALDLRVLAIMSALGLVTSLAFGLLPAVLIRRIDLQGELRRSPGRSLAGGWKAQRALVGAQFGLSMVLLAGTGLLARSLAAELSVHPGFRAEGLVSFDITLPPDAYPTPDARSGFFRAVTARVSAVPGVAMVTGISALPFSGRGGSSSFEIRGRETPQGEKGPEALRRSVLPGYHEAMGVGRIEGRTIEPGDRDGGLPVTVVSRAMVDRFWPGRSPLGERIVRDRREWEVIGVVDDLLTDDLKATAQPMFYTPFHQEEAGVRSRLSLVVRATGDPEGITAGVRRAIWEIDATLALDRVEPLPALLARATAAQRYRTFLLSLFALVATVLSAVGAFGVVARSLVNRTRDLGTRLALGAGPRRLVAQEMARELSVLAIGIGIGTGTALAAARLIGRFMYGISAYDPATYATAAAGLVGLGLLATYLATRRIVRLDPASVLRAE